MSDQTMACPVISEMEPTAPRSVEDSADWKSAIQQTTGLRYDVSSEKPLILSTGSYANPKGRPLTTRDTAAIPAKRRPITRVVAVAAWAMSS